MDPDGLTFDEHRRIVAGVCVGSDLCPCADQDGDGYADCNVSGCDPSSVQCGDCDDSRPEVHPGASDTCNHADDDCNGAVDEGSAKIWSDTPILDPGGTDGDRFGAAPAAIGDLNGDGAPTARRPDRRHARDLMPAPWFAVGRGSSVLCRRVDLRQSERPRLGVSARSATSTATRPGRGGAAGANATGRA
jgi:hypothetical protein